MDICRSKITACWRGRHSGAHRAGRKPGLVVPASIFDSPPLFCSLLDSTHGGTLPSHLPAVLESRQFYEYDTALLVTEMRTSTGLLRVTDLWALVAGADLRKTCRRHDENSCGRPPSSREA